MVRNVTKLVVVALTAAAMLLSAACTPQDTAANEQKAQDVINAIKNGAAVTASAIKSGVDAVCANQIALAGLADATRAGLQTQSGPNTAQNLKNLDTAMVTLNNVCATVSANPNDPAMAALLKSAWSAYLTVKIATATASQGG